jgi:Protein of unknown function, DUF488
MAGAEFETGLAALETLAGDCTAAMMCAEGLWWRCHRRLVSDALTAHGWEVVHVGPERVIGPSLTPPPRSCGEPFMVFEWDCALVALVIGPHSPEGALGRDSSA